MNKTFLIILSILVIAILLFIVYKRNFFKTGPDSSMTQQEANTIAAKISQLYKDANQKYGGMTSETNKIKNELVLQLSNGGYSYQNGIAVKK
jgi:hypothetical protein